MVSALLSKVKKQEKILQLLYKDIEGFRIEANYYDKTFIELKNENLQLNRQVLELEEKFKNKRKIVNNFRTYVPENCYISIM